MLAVVDIDGVVADVRHRLRHVAGRPKDWDAFFAAAGDDTLLAEGAHVVRRLAEVYDIVYLSGRPERLRQVTERWFADHELPAGELRLRRDDDFRPARVYKLQALRRLADTRRVAVLVDDDPHVLDDARRAGFDVMPATWMGEHGELRDAQEREGRT
jgi:phosphoglycolate phosphatase-like HAD superfamily hydrolase